MSMGNALEKINNIGGAIPGASAKLNLPKDPYVSLDTNWYQSKPYGFAFYSIGSDGKTATSTMYLPIAPSNLTITTSYATNVITTLYGIIEEHSEIRYYDISIDGTTGIAPRYINETGNTPSYTSSGRLQFDPGKISLHGFLPEVTNTIKQIANTVGSITNTITGAGGNPTGVTPTQSGYAAFHNLYRFLHKYKQDAAGLTTAPAGRGGAAASGPTRRTHPLRFLNYKDGNQYDVVPISFTMKRSADNPMLYNYSIKLKAFNLRTVNDNGFLEGDQRANLGLESIEGSSLFSNLTSVAGNAATLISGLL